MSFEEGLRSWFTNLKDIEETTSSLNLKKAFDSDYHPKKMHLSQHGFHQAEENYFQSVISKAKIMIVDDACHQDNYHPLGMPMFSELSIKMLLGSDTFSMLNNLCFGVQTTSPRGALSLAAKFLASHLHMNTVYYPSSVPEFIEPFKTVGFTRFEGGCLWNFRERKFDLDSFLDQMKDCPPNSVLLTRACMLNNLGEAVGPWKRIARFVAEKKLFVILDCSYQGLSSGDLDKDAYGVRYLVKQGFEMFLIQSFGRPAGMAADPIGHLIVLAKDRNNILPLKYAFQKMVFSLYGYPCLYGIKLLTLILNSPDLFAEWKKAIKKVAEHIKRKRINLRAEIECLGTPGDWTFLTNNGGMYFYSGMTPHQIEFLRRFFHIYMFENGEINVCRFREEDIPYIGKAIYEAVVNNYEEI